MAEPCIDCAMSLRHAREKGSPSRTRSVSCRSRYLTREAETHVLPRDLYLAQLIEAEGSEAAQDERDQLLGGRGPGGQAHGLVPREQIGIQPALAVDQARRRPVAL